MSPIHGESHRIFTSPSNLNSISLHFTIEPLLSVASHCFAIDSSKILQKVNKISIGSEKLPHTLFFWFKENFLFWRQLLSAPHRFLNMNFEHLRLIFCGNSQRLKAVAWFCRRAPSWMFDRILNTILPNNLL